MRIAFPFSGQRPQRELDAACILGAADGPHLRGRGINVGDQLQLCDVELGTEVFLDGPLVYGEREAVAHRCSVLCAAPPRASET